MPLLAALLDVVVDDGRHTALRTAEVGASIVAVLRGETYTDLEPDVTLQGQDIVIITGGQPALEAAGVMAAGPERRLTDHQTTEEAR